MNRHYAYLYDDFLSDKKYEKILANIETRCSVLGIQGRVARLALFRSAREMAEELVREGAETIVLVGNDSTLEKMMWFLPDLPVTVGYVPVSEPWSIGAMLGIQPYETACDTLAARLMESLDLGKLDDRYFLTEAVLDASQAAVDIEGRYRVRPEHGGIITIRNLGHLRNGAASADARDGLLEAVIMPFASTVRTGGFAFHKTTPPIETRLLLKTGAILSEEPVDVAVDGHRLNGFKFRLSVAPRKLRFITGRDKRLAPVTHPAVSAVRDLSQVAAFDTFTPATEKMRSHGWRNWYTR